MKNKVLVLVRDATRKDFEIDLINLNLPDLEIIIPENEQAILENIKNVNIIFGNPPISKNYLHLANNLVWFQSSFAGIDSLVGENLRNDYILTNVKETYGKEISEYIFSYILLLEKQVLENLEYQKNKVWNQRPHPSIKNKTIAIMGTGSIGKEIAKVAKTFGMKTIGFRTSNENIDYFDSIYTRDNIKEFCSQADYLISVLPNTDSTKDIINKTTLSFMKKTSVFMNVGRGANVNEDDLLNALQNKDISFAVLDVFKQEPLPQEHPFWNLENIIITPHISGYISNNDRIVEIFGKNYKKFIAGEQLDYQIDFKKGY